MNASAFLSRSVTLGAALTAGLAAMAAGPTESGTDRPGGVYAYVPAEDAAGCAIACAQDQICLAWSFKATEYVGCSLKAIVPASTADPEIQSGVAPRAAAFLALTSLPKPAMSTPAAQPPKPAPEKAKPRASTPAPQAPIEPSLLGASLETPVPDARIDALPFTKIAALAPLDRLAPRALPADVTVMLGPPTQIAETEEPIEAFAFGRLALFAPLAKLTAAPLPVRAVLAAYEAPAIAIDASDIQGPSLLAPLGAAKPILLRATAAIPQTLAALIVEPETIEMPVFARFAALAPLSAPKPAPLRAAAKGAWTLTALAPEPETTDAASAVRLAAKPAGKAPQPASAPYTQIALLTPERSAPTVAPPADEELLGGPDNP